MGHLNVKHIKHLKFVKGKIRQALRGSCGAWLRGFDVYFGELEGLKNERFKSCGVEGFKGCGVWMATN